MQQLIRVRTEKSMLQVYLVRHGETQWNAERRIQGQSDSPLTAHGERQAWQVGERARTLGITHIITSDLGRTRRTAEIIAEACGCSVMPIRACASWIWACWKSAISTR
jgi:probable phosphoglycerate mutase